jgi:hypothetical protein
MALSPPRTLEENYNTLRVFETHPHDSGRVHMTVREFLNQRRIGTLHTVPYKFFIVVDVDNQIYGVSRVIPEPEIVRDNSIIECRNNTPDEFQENYRPYVNDGDKYIFINLSHPIMPRGILILKPPWIDGNEIPGTKFFKLRFLRHITKYIESAILTDPTFNPVLAQPHCHQTMPTPVYELVPMSLDDINNIPTKLAYRGGKSNKKKRNKRNRKSRKNKH